ncbi:MAG: ribosome recycling factor [Armatimonadota bacterium]
MVEEILSDAEERMKKAVEDLRRELNTIRTGRASPALLDRIMVDAYGSQMPLNQVATISVPEPRALLISPWDRNVLPAIEKAILKSDLGLTPTNDGTNIRLNIPPLTEERRKELVKRVHKLVEEHKVAVRNVRRDANEELKRLEKNRELSEDEVRRASERTQKLTDKYILEMDKIQAAKEQELLEV